MVSASDVNRLASVLSGMGFAVEHVIPPPSPIHVVCRGYNGTRCYAILAVRKPGEPYVIRRSRVDRLKSMDGKVMIAIMRGDQLHLLTLDELLSDERRAAREHLVYIDRQQGRARSRMPKGDRTVLHISCDRSLYVKFHKIRIERGMSSAELLERALYVYERETRAGIS